MRDVGVYSQFSGPDLGYSYSNSAIHSLCQDWLLHIELNLSDSNITFDAVKWAISELQRFGEQEPFSGYESTQDTPEGSSSWNGDEQDWGGRGQSLEESFSRLQSSSHADRGWSSGESSERDGSEGRIDLQRWRTMLAAAGGLREVLRSGGLNADGDKRASVNKFEFSSALRDAVIAAEGGEAGNRMADRINSRLELPECVFLTKLVSHCLLVSLDQKPTVGARVDSHPSSAELSQYEWMWLHRWLVRTLLPGTASDLSYNALDWLVAYMTASRGTITMLVLDDLITDLQKLDEGDEHPQVATYIRQTGLLEYAARRWD